MERDGETLLTELSGVWAMAERMISAAGREDLAETARILALQSAVYARRFGELPLEDHLDYLQAQTGDRLHDLDSPEAERLLALLRDGTIALVGVLSVVAERSLQFRQVPH